VEEGQPDFPRRGGGADFLDRSPARRRRPLARTGGAAGRQGRLPGLSGGLSWGPGAGPDGGAGDHGPGGFREQDGIFSFR